MGALPAVASFYLKTVGHQRIMYHMWPMLNQMKGIAMDKPISLKHHSDPHHRVITEISCDFHFSPPSIYQWFPLVVLVFTLPIYLILLIALPSNFCIYFQVVVSVSFSFVALWIKSFISSPCQFGKKLHNSCAGCQSLLSCAKVLGAVLLILLLSLLFCAKFRVLDILS